MNTDPTSWETHTMTLTQPDCADSSKSWGPTPDATGVKIETRIKKNP